MDGRRVAILAADGVERVDLERPQQALEDAGARTVVVSITSGEILARDHDLEDAGSFAVDQLVGSVSVDDYEALLLPGGTVNPDTLRMEPAGCCGSRASRSSSPPRPSAGLPSGGSNAGSAGRVRSGERVRVVVRDGDLDLEVEDVRGAASAQA